MSLDIDYSVGWKSPANIALVKYWGKYGEQLPCNPSVSLTLNHSTTSMMMAYKKSDSFQLTFYFDGFENQKFEKKIKKFLEGQFLRFPWLTTARLTLESSNTFPHSSGIASSASSMSALCLCLLSMDEKIAHHKCESFFSKASELSRLASGSASRSLFGGLVSWGDISQYEATPIPEMNIHPIFNNYCDSVLIVDDTEKSVSSRAGHSLMSNHPFAEQRFIRARKNYDDLMIAIKNGDQKSFIEIVEEEALMLHALMMTSMPSYILLKPLSLLLIEEVRSYRQQTGHNVCFTIDAGPNLHLLYPLEEECEIKKWIDTSLSPGLTGQKIIHDKVGLGPTRLEELKGISDSIK